MSYPSKPTGDNILPVNTIFADNNISKVVMSSTEILNGYNNDGEAETALTSRPDANRFNMFWYQVHNTVKWVIGYIEELYVDKLSKTGGTMSGNLSMGGSKLTNIPNPTANLDAANKQYVDSQIPGAMWIGEIKTMVYPNIPSLPSGMEVVPCDGRAISRTTYATLYSLIGTSFGVGDGSTTFNIPDYRGLFLRGWNGGSSRDAGRVFGSIQQSGLPNHNHTFSGTTGINNASHSHTRGTMNITASGFMGEAYGQWATHGTGALYYAGKGLGSNGGQDWDNYIGYFDASRSWTGSTSAQSANHGHNYSGTTGSVSNSQYQNINEVRPVNSTCYYLIRIK